MSFDTQGMWQGAGTGAGIGGAIGSVVPVIGTAIGTGIGGLLGGAAGGFFGRQKSQETNMQKNQKQLVDQLLGSLQGQGPYSSLFAANPEDFERSFAAPARQRFQRQTAPQIQQAYISSGQQRGTGLDDTLTRAGVDMDQLLNEHYMQFQQGAQNRQLGAMGTILGQGPGAAPQQSGMDAAMQGVGGYLSSPGFGTGLQGILEAFGEQRDQPGAHPNALIDQYRPPSKGFEQQDQIYNPYTGIQEYGR